jgi:hypothetical protein
MHIWTDLPELSLIEALQKWLNLHFWPEQSYTNKFGKKWQLRLIMQHTVTLLAKVFSKPGIRHNPAIRTNNTK